MRRTALVVFGCWLLAACTDRSAPLSTESPSAALDQVTGGEEWIATPAGWYHRSCVHEIAAGATFRPADLRVTRSDGTGYQLPPCAYPHYSVLRQVTPPRTGGWYLVAVDSLAPTAEVADLRATWAVPAPPVQPDTGQQLYYAFPGLQNGDVGSSEVIQPVLQWGYNGYFGGNYWTLASWYCGPVCAMNPSHLNVYQGDTIFGWIYANNCSGGQCDWTIQSEDQSTAHYGNVSLTYHGTQNFSWIAGGVVET